MVALGTDATTVESAAPCSALPLQNCGNLNLITPSQMPKYPEHTNQWHMPAFAAPSRMAKAGIVRFDYCMIESRSSTPIWVTVASF